VSLEDFAGPDAGARRYDILDSTGAGDALAAGFLLGLLKHSTPHECANLAFVMALSASSGLGARAALPRRRSLVERWRLHLPDVTAPAWLIDDDEQPCVS
jgi:sugar/nucleoside kinase (ribokinase family)